MVQRPPGAASGEPEQQALFGWPDIAATPDAQPAFRDSPEARRMLDVREVYAEPAALDSPRGRQIMARLPGARVTEVASHWGIPSSTATTATPPAGSGSRPGRSSSG